MAPTVFVAHGLHTETIWLRVKSILYARNETIHGVRNRMLARYHVTTQVSQKVRKTERRFYFTMHTSRVDF